PGAHGRAPQLGRRPADLLPRPLPAPGLNSPPGPGGRAGDEIRCVPRRSRPYRAAMTTDPGSSPRPVEVTAANIGTALAVRVRPDQERLVGPVAKSLAEAYVHPDVAWPRLIADGGRAVGFLMAFFDADWFGDGRVRRSGL